MSGAFINTPNTFTENPWIAREISWFGKGQREFGLSRWFSWDGHLTEGANQFTLGDITSTKGPTRKIAAIQKTRLGPPNSELAAGSKERWTTKSADRWVKSQIVPPVNIPIPTKIGSKMGGEFTYPKMGSQNGFDPQPGDLSLTKAHPDQLGLVQSRAPRTPLSVK